MASAALGGSYVLSNQGASELVSIVSQGSAPVSSPGFSSKLADRPTRSARLSELDKMVRQASPKKR